MLKCQIETEEEKMKIKLYALEYHKDITQILDEIKKELLLLLKTNNYLRAIDSRLGNPNNSFNTIVCIGNKNDFQERLLGTKAGSLITEKLSDTTYLN
mmetsp:Transcript_42613/g.40892  ORF Transcript_42613/g.40892 Transcript_42613/m.40892 type:complete len:98 (-) Transcript_42613:115-408(-)